MTKQTSVQPSLGAIVLAEIEIRRAGYSDLLGQASVEALALYLERVAPQYCKAAVGL